MFTQKIGSPVFKAMGTELFEKRAAKGVPYRKGKRGIGFEVGPAISPPPRQSAIVVP